MLCKNCGTQAPERANYCWKCGKPMRQGVKEEARWETLEIIYQPGATPGSSCFAAKAIGLFGVYISGESSNFECADRPDQLNKDHVSKLDNLLNRLIEAGWEINPERGSEWWNHRFRRKMVEKKTGTR